MNNLPPAGVLRIMTRTLGSSLLRPLLLAASALPLAGCLTYDEFGSYGAVSSYGYGGYGPVYASGYPSYYRSNYRPSHSYRPYSSSRGGWWSGSRSAYRAPDHRPRYDSFQEVRSYKKPDGGHLRVMNLDRRDNRGAPVVFHSKQGVKEYSKPRSSGSNKVIKTHGDSSRGKIQPAFVTHASGGRTAPKRR